MIKHIVMWRLREGVHGLDRAGLALTIKEKLESLRGRIPGLLKIEVGIDIERLDTSADLVLYSEFENRAALAAYHHHPLHLAVLPYIGAARSERRGVDYEVPA